MATRTTVQIADDLHQRLVRAVEPRGINRFVNQAIAARLDAIEREQLEAALRDGYIASARGGGDVARDWESVDLEGWPD
jgi:hypothetical protein